MADAKISQASWLDADENQELCNTAGDIAWDALAGYWDARDMPRALTSQQCKQIAADEAYKGRRGWEYASADANDPAGDLAHKVLARVGFRVAHGSIGFDAVLAPL